MRGLEQESPYETFPRGNGNIREWKVHKSVHQGKGETIRSRRGSTLKIIQVLLGLP